MSPSSPPLLQPSILHPPRSQCQTPTRGIPEETIGALPSLTAGLSPCPRPKKKHSRISPVRDCLIAEGWRAQGSRYRAISIHSASLPSAQAPQLTGDHNIYHARKLKLKGTRRFISPMSRVISGKDLKIYPPACYVAHLFTDRWRTWNVTVVIKRKICFTCEGAETRGLILFTLNSMSRGDICLPNNLNTTV